MDDTRVERILRVVERVPAGQVATYGDIGAVAGESPRLVGRVLATWGSNVPWWRVCNARGEIPGHLEQAYSHWQDEGTPLRVDGRVALGTARIGADALAHLSAPRLAELGEGQA
ncbi:MGMT family protein [Rothia nasimurium]|uniref:MGMT family protein n=1 Tax=Rothia nasimurium TaxID=85336 RepID=UPI001F000751|nr:MGMT family protein [Rothia nasimurium]